MKTRPRSRKSGVALIMALLFSALLVAIVAVVASSQEEVARSRINKLDELKAKNAAESGLQLAITTLASQSTTATTQNDQWDNIGGTPTQPGSIEYQVGNESFRIQIVDACSRIDLNTASNQQLLNLPLTQVQVDSLLDWREQGLTARADGAKDAFYLGLPNPYLTRLGRIDSLDELLLIDNFSPSTLFDTPTQLGITPLLTSGSNSTANYCLSSICTVDALTPNAATAGRPKVNISTPNFTALTLEQRGIPPNLANLIFQRRPITSLGVLFSLPGINSQNAQTLLNDVTTTTATTLEGKININTASETVLTSLPGMTPTIAQQIVSQQPQTFASIASLLTVSGITPQLASSFIDDVCTASETFIVHIVGTSGSTNVPMIATIQLNGTTPKIIKLESPPFPDMATRWQWFDVQQTIDAVNATTQSVTTSSSASGSPSSGGAQ